MSIVTFWNNENEQTGKTLSAVAIATYMAIKHNYKILLVSTGYNDKTINNCFWENKKTKKNVGLFGPNTNTAMQNGIEGLAKIIRSNKITPQSITNYAKVVFKDTFEILTSFTGTKERYDELKENYVDIITTANEYYDLVLVDLDYEMGENLTQSILKMSNLIVVTLSQRLSSINKFIEEREKIPILKSKKSLMLISRYDKFSKYTVKNISRYMEEKNKVSTIPYNTLFFEAAEEARVPDLFLNVRKIDEDDRNGFFLAEVGRTTENIIYRLQDLSMGM